MIIIRMRGGLGNQLFQYSFGYALHKEYDQELYFDFSFFNNQPSNVGKRKIEIKSFNVIGLKEYTSDLAVSFFTNRYIGAFTRKLPARYIKLPNNLYYFKEPERKYVENIQIKGDSYFDGYWQSSRYFSKYRNELLEQFTLANNSRSGFNNFLLELSKTNSVAVHIRKGDFGKGTIRKVGHLLEPKYYLSAIDYCIKKISDPIFYVFTDDKDWAASLLCSNNNIRFVSDILKTNSVEDLLLISNAKNGIMSASTFSWWGNWLRKSDGVVVVPNGCYYNDCFYENKWVRI